MCLLAGSVSLTPDPTMTSPEYATVSIDRESLLLTILFDGKDAQIKTVSTENDLLLAFVFLREYLLRTLNLALIDVQGDPVGNVIKGIYVKKCI